MACTTCEARRRLNDPTTPPELRAEAEEVLKAAAERIEKLTLDTLYLSAVRARSDIERHVPKLKELAEQCRHVTDIGMRPEVSSVALLAGQPEKLVHVVPPGGRVRSEFIAKEYAHVRGSTDVSVIAGTTPTMDIEETDLLFLDTKHTANQILLELEKYAPLTRRYIVRHDTQIFGETGEDGGPGLLVGIRQYLREHPEWSVVYETDEQYGLIVLSRDDRDKRSLPSMARQAFNFSRHLVKIASEGGELVPDDVFNARLDACMTCPMRVTNRCTLCGCFLDRIETLGKPGKAAYAAESCPLEPPKWGKHETGT